MVISIVWETVGLGQVRSFLWYGIWMC